MVSRATARATFGFMVVRCGPCRCTSLDLIEALQFEGHDIAPGSVGENLTIDGLQWTSMLPGRRLGIGCVQLELTDYASPCCKIASLFADRDSARISQRRHPGWSRIYARVLREGTVKVGDGVTLIT